MTILEQDKFESAFASFYAGVLMEGNTMFMAAIEITACILCAFCAGATVMLAVVLWNVGA